MQKLFKSQNKRLLLVITFLLFATWCNAAIVQSSDGYSAIQVKEANVQHTPKGSSIQATIDGHYLTVAFLENLGQVSVEITAVDDGLIVDYMTMTTPNGYQYYIVNTGTYIVTFTLENGDVYYGQFSVTD
jgi:hypothetical protein